MLEHSRGVRQKHKSTNPLVHGIKRFVAERAGIQADTPGDTRQAILPILPDDRAGIDLHDGNLPKRYTIYGRMLLLPLTFLTHSQEWQAFYKSLSGQDKTCLGSAIASAFQHAGQGITHVAINAPIQAARLSRNGSGVEENVTRSPTALQPLSGDFGPAWLLSDINAGPTAEDFEAAFWVEACQVRNVRQVWAPRWTMFSRGNIREKARILGDRNLNPSVFPGICDEQLKQQIGEVDVVDMYVGVGYFAIPFLRRGIRRVLGWELNGWSIEGLRRGCKLNGFGCEVFEIEEALDETRRLLLVDRVVTLLRNDVHIRCVAFWGNNKIAGEVLSGVRTALEGEHGALNVRHCNLGLLPTSQGSWEGAVKLIDPSRGGWLHVHETAEMSQMEQKRQSVVNAINILAGQIKGFEWQASCEHSELVKTYAPGVGHFVFDIRVVRQP